MATNGGAEISERVADLPGSEPAQQPPEIGALRARLESGHKEARRLLEGGAAGRDAAHAIANATDAVIVELFEAGLRTADDAVRQELANSVSLLPFGGYGRRDLAPFSDVDLLILHARGLSQSAGAVLKHFVRDIWDVGLSLGLFVGTVGEVLRLARKETLTATALLEARRLLGPQAIFADLRRRLGRRLLWGRDNRLVERFLSAQRDEQTKFGSSVFLLEPDVKRSAGGLRDIHLLRWIAAIRFGHADPAWLAEHGKLPAADFEILERAHDLLLRVRAEMHFHAGKSADVLHRAEQLRIAKKWGYCDRPHLLAVEQFMREYFRRCTAMREVVERFVERHRPAKLGAVAEQVLFSRQVAPGVAIAGNKLTVDEAMLARVLECNDDLVDIATLAAWHDVELDAKLVDALRDWHAPETAALPRALPSEPVATEKMLNLLSRPGGIARTLRTLHRVGALERLLPEFESIRCLLQFNAYHKYTVDEHTFVMLAHAEELAKGDDELADCYRKIARKDLLHLAILLHDIGKGREADHSEVGAEIAAGIADRVGLSADDRDCLVFLVLRHLSFSNLAFHRDISDRELCLQLTRDLGSVEMLRKLYVLTCVDTMAVGPGNFNRWRADILADLYRRLLDLFGEPAETRADSVSNYRRELLAVLGARALDREHAARFVDALGGKFLRDADLELAAADYVRWRAAPPDAVLTTACHHPATNTATYTILTHEKIADGVFHRICGALAAHRLEVLSARIQTLADGSVVDQFEVVDIHHSGAPTRERRDTVAATIRRVLAGELAVNDVLWSGRSSAFAPKRKLLTAGKTRIAVDNESSEFCTIVDVFTGDRRGVLYTLAKGIFRLGLSVQFAAISTYADEVMDVFYVQEADGKKVQRVDRMQMIRDHLASDLARLATDPRSMGF